MRHLCGEYREKQLISRMANHLEDTLLSVADFAALTRAAETAASAAVRDGRLLSVRKSMPDGTSESGVAAFQALPEIRGEPLSCVLAALGFPHSECKAMDSALAYSFFLARHELLGELTPIEVLTASPRYGVSKDVGELLARSHSDRVDFVVKVAKATAELLRHS